jgi:hypothetical protein
VTTLKLVVFPEVIVTDPGWVVIVGVTGRAFVNTVVEDVPAAEFP